jgi:hypothetical protein
MDYGLYPGSIRQLPKRRQKWMRRYFTRLNPEIAWNVFDVEGAT